MTLQSYEAALHELLQEPLGRLGFSERTRLEFVKGRSDATKVLTFPTRLKSDRLFFACMVGVHFPAIEKLVRAGSAQEIIPTIFVPIHLLHEDRAFFEWSMDKSSASEDLSGEVIAEIKKYAVPFLERFSVMENVKTSLESSDPADWFVLSPEQRISILAAVSYLNGDRKQAIEAVETALAERQDAPPKKRRNLEIIRMHLVDGQEKDS